MRKKVNKFIKMLLLSVMIFSDLMTPVKVFADEIAKVELNHGDVGINNNISNNGDSASVAAGAIRGEDGSLTNNGDVSIIKTVSKAKDSLGNVIDGRYNVEFNIKGKDAIGTPKPFYVVVVFDQSGSMDCEEYEENWFWGKTCARKGTKWDDAVAGAKNFASTLLAEENMPTAHIGLVTFSDGVTIVRDFSNPEESNKDFTNVNFGYAEGATNLHAGLKQAYELFDDDNVPSDASKYVVVISDGQPTYYVGNDGYVYGPGDEASWNVLNATYNEANTMKNNGIEIFSIGYKLPDDSVYDDTYNSDVSSSDKFGNLTAHDILRNVASQDTEENKKNGITHYFDSNLTNVSDTFGKIAKLISKIPAGTGATLTDNIGTNFKIVGQDGSTYTSAISEITEAGTTISFQIEMDKSSVYEEGWYNTNEGFTLEYTDSDNKKVTVTCSDNPQVWITPDVYEYTVNYYKDSFDTEVIASDSFEAINGTLVNENNIDKVKYLNNSELGTVGYEYNTINGVPVTVNSNDKVINVLYVIKKFSYSVNYYYDGLLEEDKTINEGFVDYGTKVNASNYYELGAREGYSLDTNNSTSGEVIIDSDNKIINVYYRKNSYDYTVNYFFNNVMDSDFTKKDNALYGSVVNASDEYLKDNEIEDKNKEDNTEYFVNPSRPSAPSKITIGTDSSNNVINVYYVSTVVTEEKIEKNADTDKIVSSDTLIKYTVNYKSVIHNVNKGDTVKVVITDTLPLEIDLDKSNLDVTMDGKLVEGVYDSETRTITWTFEEIIQDFTEVYDASKNIEYTVLYLGLGTSDGKALTNSVIGTTTAGGKTTKGEGTGDVVTVEIPCKVTVHHYIEGTATSVYTDEILNGLVGEQYRTSSKDIFGYTLVNDPSNKNGVYTEEETVVTYYYRKNNGVIDEDKTDVIKESNNTDNKVENVDSKFNYTITAKGEVKDYVGVVIVKVTDTLPYELTEEAISGLDNRCIYDRDSKTIVCTSAKNISKEDYTNGVYVVNEVFNLELTFVDVTEEVVVNSAKVEIVLDGGVKDEDTDTEEVVVKKGNVTVTYKDTLGNKLHENVNTSDLVGKEYTTEEKVFYGYTLTEVPANKSGTYTKKDITVDYVYSKNVGTSSENLNKTGTEIVDNKEAAFKYVITYNTVIKDYIGEASLVITDELPYEIDVDKSIYNKETCEYTDGKLVCTYKKNINEHDNSFDIEEKMTLYYINVDNSEVVNKVYSILEYGSSTKENDSEYTSRVKEGTVIVSYVTKDGTKLTDDVILTGLVGEGYTTDKKVFDKYSFIEVKGEVNGEYTEEVIEVTYVYDVTPLPPQTGIDFNMLIFVKYIVYALIIFVSEKTYKLIKNN